MAKKKKQSVNWRSINNRLDSIDLQMQDAYKTTYNSTQSNNSTLRNISDDIMSSIDALVADDSDIQGIPDISRLYNRLKAKEESSFNDKIFDIFNDKTLIDNLMDVYSKSRSIRQMDDQIDTVCRYMPKLQNALDIMKDSVLVSETFSKDYLNLISGLNKNDESFATRAVVLKNKYDLENLFDTVYSNTSKYGECFVYLVPYKKAFEQILIKRGKSPRAQVPSIGISQETTIIESGSFVKSNGLLVDSSFNAPNIREDAKGTFTLNFKVGCIDEVVNEYDKIDELKHKVPKGLYEQFLDENAILESSDKDIKTTTADTKVGKDSVKFNNLIPDELKYEPLDNTANDGLVDPTKKNAVNPHITTPGCVVKILKRDRVFPIYIEDSCIGYYYLEYVNPGYADSTSLFKNSIVSDNATKNNQSEQDDRVLKYLAAQISKNMDAAFINANIDLSKEIYMILKYDEKFNIANPSGKFNASFIPAEDIHHHYFKMDLDTHRGVSDLYDGLIPATIWCMLSLCTSVGIVTRGQDKRVYYVQQNGLETNVAKTLMNVINQIKRGNFGVRQLESINNILGIVGKYNDYVIPKGPNGEAPVDFSILQGQDINPPTEMMQTMEENAINSTGVPLELVNATKGLDYAVHYTVSNSRFMTIVTKRQGKEQKMESNVCTKIYNCEYEENTLVNIMLPEPRFIAMGNTNSVIDNVRQYAQNITDIYGYDMDDAEKAEFMNLIMRNRLASHINCDMIDNLKSLAKVNIAVKKQPEEQ